MTLQEYFATMFSFMPVTANMNVLTLPDYEELQLALTKTTLKLHPSQVHGLSCGVLCGKETVNETAWEEISTGIKAKALREEIHVLLQQLYEQTKQQLEEFSFEFELLLPHDGEHLTERAEALTLWCQGFLTGLKIAKIAITSRSPGEATEAINDLVEIAKMNYEEVVESDEDEAAYIELIEFVRMAVILIYQDERGEDANKQITRNNLH